MNSRLNRRQFLKRSALAAGSLALASGGLLRAQAAAKRTAVDEVTLGKTGLKLSRLGMGAGSSSGQVQTALGRDGFTKLVHYAYDQGIRYFDCAESYATFEWLGAAIKGLPREKLFLQSKIGGKPPDVLAAIDRHRKVYRHRLCGQHARPLHGQGHAWTDEWKRIMDGFDQARDKKWIRAKGVSCHSLPALRAAIASDWTQVHLVRVNPQGRRMDGMEETVWSAHRPRPRDCARACRIEKNARQGPRRHRHENHRRRQVRQSRKTAKNPFVSPCPGRNWTPWSSASRAPLKLTKPSSG